MEGQGVVCFVPSSHGWDFGSLRFFTTKACFSRSLQIRLRRLRSC